MVAMAAQLGARRHATGPPTHALLRLGLCLSLLCYVGSQVSHFVWAPRCLLR